MFSTIATTTVLGPAVPENDAAILSNTGMWYFSIFGGDRSANRYDVESAISDSGVVVRFTVGINAAPGTGSWTFTLLDAGNPIASCTISANKRSCSKDTAFAVGSDDKISVSMMPGSGTDSPANVFSAAAFQIKLLAQ